MCNTNIIKYDASEQIQEQGDKVLNIRDESGAIKHYSFYAI